MAAQDVVGDTFSGLFGSLTNTMVIILVFIIVIAVGGTIFWYFGFYRKKFDIMVKILSRRAGEDKIIFDKAAILKDKKNRMEYLKLLNLGTQIELPKFDIFYHTNKGDYVEILRESEKGFTFLTPPMVDRKFIVRRDGKVYPFTEIKQRQMENDISWILHRERVNKSLLNPESMLMKLLNYAPQIISAIISMMILWVVLRYAPDLMDSMREFAKVIKEGTKVETIGGFIYSLIL